MSEELLTLEIPDGVIQPDLWQLESELRQTEGIARVSLQEKRDFGATAMLIIGLIPVAVTYVKQGIDTLDNFKAAALKLHEFLHPAEQKTKEDEEARKKIVLPLPDGTKVELYDYSVEELKELLATKKLPRRPKK